MALSAKSEHTAVGSTPSHPFQRYRLRWILETERDHFPKSLMRPVLIVMLINALEHRVKVVATQYD